MEVSCWRWPSGLEERMAKAMVEVDVPDGWELAEPAMRCPKAGEHFLLENRNYVGVERASCDFAHDFHAIVRKAWQWPAWLKAPWIAMCGETGHWWGYSNEPGPREGSRRRWTGGYETWLNPQLLDFTPPPCDDWRQSKRKNPNL